MVQALVELDESTNRVLNIVKAKYNLRDKGEAIKFVISEYVDMADEPELRPEFIETLIKEVPFYKERLLVKPGLTGWAQIKMPYADSVESSLKKLQYDLYYIKHRSLFFDLSVILKTINTVLKKIGR